MVKLSLRSNIVTFTSTFVEYYFSQVAKTMVFTSVKVNIIVYYQIETFVMYLQPTYKYALLVFKGGSSVMLLMVKLTQLIF